MSVKFTNHRADVQRQVDSNVARTLTAIGLKATEITQMNIRASGRVDTSTMVNSVDSQVNPRDKEVVHGIGAFYGIFQELGTRRGIAPGNFIRDNLNNHTEDYRAIVQDMMGEGF